MFQLISIVICCVILLLLMFLIFLHLSTYDFYPFRSFQTLSAMFFARFFMRSNACVCHYYQRNKQKHDIEAQNYEFHFPLLFQQIDKDTKRWKYKLVNENEQRKKKQQQLAQIHSTQPTRFTENFEQYTWILLQRFRCYTHFLQIQ